MRILITGAAGNIGRGLASRLTAAGHELVLADVNVERIDAPDSDARAVDVREPGALDDAAVGCDLIAHLPAWHGIHSGERSEREFWTLNVDGTYFALESAARAQVPRILFLSSQSWHSHYGKYGFTKRIGEELVRYRHENDGMSYVAVRPGDLTPWTGDWATRYGRRLLYGGVDRDDVLDAIVASIDHLEHTPDAALVVDAVGPHLDPQRLARWDDDPSAALNAIFPGAAEVVARFGLDIRDRPRAPHTTGWSEVGYVPRRDFGSFVRAARGVTPEQAQNMASPY